MLRATFNCVQLVKYAGQTGQGWSKDGLKAQFTFRGHGIMQQETIYIV